MSNKLPVPVTRGSDSVSRVSPLQLYLQEIAQYPLLEPEEEYELAVDYHTTENKHAAHRLITSNLRLVVKIANDFRQAQSSLLDMIQEGNYGLMQAVKRYNPYKGVKLSSYAAWWIRAYILKYIMDNKSQVRIGTTAAQRKLFFNLRKEAERLLREYERVDPKMIAESLNVKEKDVVEMQQRLQAPEVSLDAPVSRAQAHNGSAGMTQGDLMASPEVAADDLLADEQIKQVFADHLEDFRKTLKERDLDFFQSRMVAESPLTLQELGNKYGISRERARQIEARILKNLKKFVLEKGTLDISAE